MSWHQQRNFSALRQSSLKTARAWAIKEFASRLWEYRSRTWAYKGWKRLINWMARSRLKPMPADRQNLAQAPVGHSQCGDTGREQQPCREHELAHQNSEDPCQRVQKQTAVSGMRFTSIWVVYNFIRLVLKHDLPTMIGEEPNIKGLLSLKI